MDFENIIAETKDDGVALITLHRPDALNALNSALIDELGAAIDAFEADDSIGCIVVTGSEKAFAAGADIKQMQAKSYMDAYMENFISKWERITTCRKPVIAAVNGFALGGGCELAMMCDFIIAGDKAKFGQPEIKLGILPGAGGSQRLTRYVGKSKAMEMCLTGRMMDAAEAERCGLVSRIIADDKLVEEAFDVAQKIAEKSLPSVLTAKECVNVAYETGLKEGVHYERRVFHSLFAFEDKKEGMAAFIEKRQPKFNDK